MCSKPSPDKSLRLTFGPLPIFSTAKPAIVSNADELGYWGGGNIVFLMTAGLRVHSESLLQTGTQSRD
tara:strand:+ start:2523 stop:2726 length:204 start_codon:yes stop_codon:yes gene_type:complete